ncbi:MAG: MoxR family ATPase, partial [Oligoflexia bacterium]|nr:MoxR family ATPase [Oligoflexia bacterium]
METLAGHENVTKIYSEISKVIVGQKYMMERLLIGLLCDGHVLVEGVPGLAKTLTVKTLSDVLDLDFKRVQFTPDLLPADLIGTVIYNQADGRFIPKKGPIFTNILLADEINRAPAKVQSALLESMAEKQVTIGDETYKLDDPYLVLATQNPIEQEGTYPLPEAQMDRFMLKLKVSYPSREEERVIMDRMTGFEIPMAASSITAAVLKSMKKAATSVYLDEKIKSYILEIVFATREPASAVEYGASPRASIYLLKAARAHAYIQGRNFVIPEDVKAVVYDVLRHRVIVSFEAEAQGLSSDDIIKTILDH